MKNKIVPVVLIVIFILSSCAPRAAVPALTATGTAASVPTATLTAVPTATTVPTITPTPVTYLPGLSMKVPEPGAAFIQQVVSENYLTVMGLTRDQVALSYKELTDIDGQPYVVMLDESTGVPMAVFTEGIWQKAKMKFFGEQVGITIGSSGFPSDRLPIIYGNTKNAFMDSSIMTVGSPWNNDEPQRGKVDTSQLNYWMNDMLRYAEKELGIHNFIFHPIFCPRPGNIPDWVLNGNFSKAELRRIMRSRIVYVITNTPEVSEYVVVNEPYMRDHEERKLDPFYKVWGNYDYIKEMFQITRETADRMGRKDVKLIFNDDDNNTTYGANSQSSREIATMLHTAGLIDALGMQMHLNQWGGAPDGQVDVASFSSELEFYKNLGVPVFISELTYETTQPTELAMSPAEFDNQLAQIFSAVFTTAIDSGNVEGITFWAPIDPFDQENWHKLRWYHIYYDDNLPRKGYYEVMKVLYERSIN